MKQIAAMLVLSWLLSIGIVMQSDTWLIVLKSVHIIIASEETSKLDVLMACSLWATLQLSILNFQDVEPMASKRWFLRCSHA
jgi:hypothetical protein